MNTHSRLGLRKAVLVAALVGVTGCGAAYYGTAVAVFVTQEDTKLVDTSFPDAKPTADEVPAFATLALSTEQITVQRRQGDDTVDLTDFQILGVNFPAGYGESRSNRDASNDLLNADEFVIRINQDTSRLVTFDSSDIATVGSIVAANIQTKVRLLAPADASVPAEAYTLFTANFDEATSSFRFASGAPGQTSEVAFQVEPRTGVNDVPISAASQVTAARLGLGLPNGGIERSGADSIAFTILNRGTDVIPAGTNVDIYLSHDKVLDANVDVLIDRVPTAESVEVGQAKRFFRRNGNETPDNLVRADITAGNYFVLFDVASSGSERVLDNNLLSSRAPVEIYQPVDDPATTPVETANTLDFAIDLTKTQIGAVTGNNFNGLVTVTNLGAPVTTPVAIELDTVLSLDSKLDSLGEFRDPTNAVAGVRINPTDPNRPITVKLVETGTTAISAAIFGNELTVTFNGSISMGADVATIQSLVDALNTSPGGTVDAFVDGNGAPATDSITALLTANTNVKETTAADVFVATRSVNFGVVDRPQQQQSFFLSGPLRTTGFITLLLPFKLVPLFRIRPGTLPVSAGTDPENTNNNVRQGANFVRVYDRARAQFDTDTGTFLPTVNFDDFAQLEAVTQRPVNTGSIRQGQQRVFSFQIPDTGASFEESQLLVILQTDLFDAHLDLLNSSGEFLTNNDDTGLGTSPVLYTPLFTSPTARTFYLVVSAARQDESDIAGGGESFDLTISVNTRETTDPGLVNAINARNVLESLEQRFATQETPRLRNNVLIPFSLANASGEIMLILPERARVKFTSSPVFTVGVDSVLTQFLQGAVPSPVEHQAELDQTFTRIVFRPAGGDIATSHVLEKGVYTVAFESVDKTPDTQPLRLEVDTEFLPAQ
ncbi:hypothetical protein OAX78_03855, partial [Planctomycetota bacterium]|nr:hypothetical protein [Planctomycetota bacterium]